MPRVSRQLVVLSLLLLGANALGKESSRGRELTRRKVTLSRSTADMPVELHVAPDYLITLEFDSPVDRAGVKLADSGGLFALFEVGTRLVTLKPANDLPPGERVLLTVPFADDRVPASALFALVLRPSEVDVQVQVARLPRTAEAVQAELDEVRAACASKDAELEALRKRGSANGPAGMILAGMMGPRGITATRINAASKSGDDLSSEGIIAYHGPDWTALSLEVVNTGSTPWTPAEARLFLGNGGRPHDLPVRMKESRLEPGKKALVVVETEGLNKLEGSDLRLELRDSAGTRRLLFGPFVF